MHALSDPLWWCHRCRALHRHAWQHACCRISHSGEFMARGQRVAREYSISLKPGRRFTPHLATLNPRPCAKIYPKFSTGGGGGLCTAPGSRRESGLPPRVAALSLTSFPFSPLLISPSLSLPLTMCGTPSPPVNPCKHNFTLKMALLQKKHGGVLKFGT